MVEADFEENWGACPACPSSPLHLLRFDVRSIWLYCPRCYTEFEESDED